MASAVPAPGRDRRDSTPEDDFWERMRARNRRLADSERFGQMPRGWVGRFQTGAYHFATQYDRFIDAKNRDWKIKALVAIAAVWMFGLGPAFVAWAVWKTGKRALAYYDRVVDGIDRSREERLAVEESQIGYNPGLDGPEAQWSQEAAARTGQGRGAEEVLANDPEFEGFGRQAVEARRLLVTAAQETHDAIGGSLEYVVSTHTDDDGNEIKTLQDQEDPSPRRKRVIEKAKRAAEAQMAPDVSVARVVAATFNELAERSGGEMTRVTELEVSAMLHELRTRSGYPEADNDPQIPDSALSEGGKPTLEARYVSEAVMTFHVQTLANGLIAAAANPDPGSARREQRRVEAARAAGVANAVTALWSWKGGDLNRLAELSDRRTSVAGPAVVTAIREVAGAFKRVEAGVESNSAKQQRGWARTIVSEKRAAERRARPRGMTETLREAGVFGLRL